LDEEATRVVDVTEGNVDDLCRLCIPPEGIDEPNFVKGVELKKRWAMDMIERWGGVAKLAYFEDSPAGMLQYEPIPVEKVVRIICIFVPHREHWRKGIGRRLLTSLIEDMKKPRIWFNNEAPLALVTRTFPGELPGQYPAQSFFMAMGFEQMGDDPNLLYYPLRRDFVYSPVEIRKTNYIPQEENKGKALIIYRPSFCPWGYVFLKRAEQEMEKAVPGISIRWINSLEEPTEVKRRGIFEGIIVNAKLIKSFLLEDREVFINEVLNALKEM